MKDNIKAVFEYLLERYFKNCIYGKQRFVDKLYEVFGEKDIIITSVEEKEDLAIIELIYKNEYVINIIYHLKMDSKVVRSVELE